MAFSVATYNVLASAYIQSAWYPRTPALVQHFLKLGADILCLQEVEPETFVALRTTLGERGYGGQYARKLAERPDGVALFYRRDAFELPSARVLAYADGAGDNFVEGFQRKITGDSAKVEKDRGVEQCFCSSVRSAISTSSMRFGICHCERTPSLPRLR